MATLQTITNSAFRELGITAVGDVPETAEYNEAFAQLQLILNTITGYEMGEPLTDVNLGSSSNLNSQGKGLDATTDITNLYVPNNVRLMCNLTSPLTIYLHPRPREGNRVVIVDEGNNFATNNVTVKGNGRGLTAIGTQTLTLNTNGVGAAYFFRADLGYWIQFDVSVDTLPNPYAPSFDDLFILMLAKRIAPRYGAQWSDIQEQSLNRLLRQFRSRYRQETEADAEYALIRLPSVLRSRNYFSNSPSDFDKGFL